MKTTITPGNRLPGSFAGTLRFGSTLQDPHTSLSTPPLHHGGGRSARKAPPPSPGQKAGRVQREVARGRGRGEPAQVTGAGGGDTAREGGRRTAGKMEPPSPYGTENGKTGKKKVDEGNERHPSSRQGQAHPCPPIRAEELLWGSFFCGLGEERGGPAPEPRIWRRKSPVRPRTQPPRRPGPPPPRRRPRQVPPLPQPGAHSPSRPATRPVSSRPSQRAVSLLSPTHLPGRLRRSPLTPPAATVHTHRLRSRTHSPSLTHSATTDPERPTYYASLACYVPRARERARTPTWREARWQGAGGELEEPRGRLGNEVPLVGAGPTSLDWCCSTYSPRIDFWSL